MLSPSFPCTSLLSPFKRSIYCSALSTLFYSHSSSMSSRTKRWLSVLMGDCAQLELSSMGTRVGTGTGATESRWTVTVPDTWLTASKHTVMYKRMDSPWVEGKQSSFLVLLGMELVFDPLLSYFWFLIRLQVWVVTILQARVLCC